MAYLNVGERRIEATIAYVGPELGGKATNFDELVRAGALLGKIEPQESTSSDVRVLRWQPSDRGRFRDCSVTVRLLAQTGPFDEERVGTMLREADGVVLVVDAQPSAQEDNRASLTSVRRAVAGDRAHVPVVLQVNKTDAAEALSPEAIVEALDASSLPVFAASAVRGVGVKETLEAALAEVLLAMQSPSLRANGAVEHDGALSPMSIADGGHPLLGALKEVLRQTMLEHADALEARATAALRGDLARVESRLDRMEHAIASLAIEASMAATKDDVGVALGRTEAAIVEGREHVARAIEGRAKSDREHIASLTTALRRSIDGVGQEVRATDKRLRIDDVGERVSDLTKHVEQVASLVADIALHSAQLKGRVDAAVGEARLLVPRLAEVDASLGDRIGALASRVGSLDDRIVALASRVASFDEGVREAATDARESAASSSALDARVDALDARMKEVVEELKKSKKGWFA